MEILTQNPDQPLSRKERKALKRQQKFEAAAAAERQAKTGRIFTWVVGAAVALAVLYGFYLLIFPSGGQITPTPANDVSAAVTADDWVKGAAEAKVTLLEYADFQCPACAAWQPTLNEVFVQYQNDLAIAYRHFPLSQHKNAIPAAQAAEAAGRQNKFWEMADKLYENQAQWQDEANPGPIFESYAQKLELNLDEFKAAYADPAVKSKINGQLAGGLAARVNSTPSFFLNGQRLSNIDPDGLKNAIKTALDAVQTLPPVQPTAPTK